MVNLTNKDFIDFLESFNNNKLFYNSVNEISKSNSNCSLIENPFKMYSLDEIVKKSDVFGENTPKTTDALWYKEDQDTGEFTLYIIEFKFYNIDNNYKLKLETILNKFKEIDDVYKGYGIENKFFNERFLEFTEIVKNGLSDNVHCSLKLKPIETLNYVLPELYKDYCGLNDSRDADDCKDFLSNITKKFYVFLIEGAYSHGLENDLYSGKRNKSKHRAHVKGFPLHMQFIRYKRSHIIDDYKIEGRYDFENFLRTEKLI